MREKREKGREIELINLFFGQFDFGGSREVKSRLELTRGRFHWTESSPIVMVFGAVSLLFGWPLVE